MIFHITSRRQWEEAQAAGEYRGDTLDGEGFIHSSQRDQVVRVANALFRGRRDLVLLCIDPVRVQPEIRYEPGGPHSAEQFPHLYGPLNLDAVVEVLPFAPEPDGTFRLPASLSENA
jgi:uncharacterized protein (DUF952 family)